MQNKKQVVTKFAGVVAACECEDCMAVKAEVEKHPGLDLLQVMEMMASHKGQAAANDE